nr:transposon Ty3-I Gag-Pol polyprotein [Tanacetum cinerariifolium]
TLFNNSEMAAEGPGDLPVPNRRTMEELCQPSLNGRGGPIASISIQETNFRLKNDMIQQVQNSCQFHGLPGDDANKHLDKFLHVTQSIKVNGVTDDGLRLRNEITNFLQCPDESLFEAWERYKLSIDRFPNHDMLPVTQINTFYNGLTLRHRDTINAAAGGTFMKRRPEKCYDLINRIPHHNDWDTSAQWIPPSCETCGGPPSFNDCPTTVGNTQNVYAAGAYQGNSYQPQGNRNLLSYRSDNYLGPPGFNQNQNSNNRNQNFHNQNRNQGNHNPQGNNQGRYQFFQGANQGQNQPPTYQAPAYQAPVYQTPVHQPHIPQQQVVTTNEFTNFIKANDAILKNMQTNMTSLTNSNLELKNMFGQFMKMNLASSSGSGTLPVHPTNNGSTKDVQPPVVPTESLILNSEPVISPIIEPVASPVSALKPNQRPSIPYPSRLQDQKLRDKANEQREKFFHIFKDLNFNISFAGALILMPKFGPSIKSLLTNKDKLYVFVKVGTFYFPVDFVVIDFDADPRVPLILGRSFLKIERALIDVLEEYSQEVLDFSDVITSGNPNPYYDSIVSTTSSTLTPFENSDFHLEEVDAFLALEDDPTSPKVDQSYEDFEPAVQHQRKINPKIHDVIKNEVLKLLDAGVIYPISDSPWVRPVHCVPKKGGFTVVENEETELILTRLATGWHVCIDYRKLNQATRKDHFPLPFMDQMLKRLAGNQYYCFLNGFSGYFQIHIDLKDQEKPHSLIHIERLLTATCLWGYAMHRACFRGIVFGHKISKSGIEVDKAKVDVIAKLPHPTTVKGIRSFLGHADFYRSPRATSRKAFRPIHYASKTMTKAESNYTTTEKEMLVVVYAFEKFRSYLIMNKSIVYTNHSALKYLFAKKDSKARLLRWVLLLQEFTFKVIDTKGAENLAANHLSRLENPHQNVLDPKERNESFPLKTLNLVSTRGNSSTPWFA